MKSALSFLKRLFGHIADDHVPAYAAQVSFFMVISALPLFTMLIPLIRYVIPISQSTITDALLAVMPNSPELQALVTGLTNDVYTNSAGTVISISLVSTLWAASKGIYSLQLGLNSVNEVKETRSYVIRRLFAIGYTIGFVFILFLTIGLLLFGNKLQLLFEYYIPFLIHFKTLIKIFRNGLSFTLFVVFFIVVYTLLPNYRTKFRRQFPGAVGAAIGWMIFSYFYSLYISQISRFSYLYGSLAALILMMLWLYICMYIVLIGAEFNKMLGNWLDERSEIKKLKKAGIDAGLEDDPE